MTKKKIKWALVGKAGQVRVFNKKPIEDTMQGVKSGFWVDTESKTMWQQSYWKLHKCEVIIIK